MPVLKTNGVFDKNLMPSKDEHCVYSLLDNDKNIVYVGQSSNLKKRVFTHLSSDKDFSYIKWCNCSKDEKNNLEAEGIVKAKTHLNKNLPKNDLYMVIGGMRREMAEELSKVTDLFRIEFESSKGSKYISRQDYDLAMRIFSDFTKNLLSELKADVK